MTDRAIERILSDTETEGPTHGPTATARQTGRDAMRCSFAGFDVLTDCTVQVLCNRAPATSHATSGAELVSLSPRQDSARTSRESDAYGVPRVARVRPSASFLVLDSRAPAPQVALRAAAPTKAEGGRAHGHGPPSRSRPATEDDELARGRSPARRAHVINQRRRSPPPPAAPRRR